MRVLVVGAGAIGSLLGWAVVAGGGETTIVRRGHTGAAVTGRLVVVRPDGSEVAASVGIVGSVAELAAAPDLVLLAVKQYDLAAALESLAAIPAVAVLTSQNGVGAEEATATARPVAPLLAGSVTASVERAENGALRWLRAGGLGLAPVQGEVSELVEALAATFRGAGLAVRTFGSASAMKWSKLVANLVGNATSALLDLDPEDVYRDPGLFGVERDQLREALAVMRARGLSVVDLPGARVRLLALVIALPERVARRALVGVVGSARGGKAPSLRGAVRGGGPTEVAWLNGAVSRAGVELSVATPVNDALAALVDEVAADPDRRAWLRSRPDRLLESLGRR